MTAWWAFLALGAGAELRGLLQSPWRTRNGSTLRPNLALDCVADFLAPIVEHGAVAAFEEETRLRFGAGVAEEDAASLGVQLRLGLFHEIEHAFKFLKGNLLAHFHVGNELRVARPALDRKSVV